MAAKKEPDMAHMKSKGATASAGGDGEGHSIGLPHGGTGRGHTGSQCRQRRQRMKCVVLTPRRILHRPFEALFLLKCNHSGAVSAGSALMLLRNTGNCCSIVMMIRKAAAEWTEAEEQGDSLSLWICALFFVLTSVACGGWRVAGRLGIEVLKYSCVEVSMKI